MLAIGVLLCLPVAAQEADDPRRDPEKAVVDAKRLLEQRSYAQFMQQYIPPDQLKEITGDRSVNDVAAAFGARYASTVLAGLAEAVTMEPVLNDSGTRATYRFERPIGGRTAMVLRKIGDYWYLE
jgi:DNA-binding PucR family transcriptional regulator